MKSGKIWGKTWEMLAQNGVRVMGLEIASGAFCSKHVHRYQWNHFSVLQGVLVVRVWKSDYDLCDLTELGPGESMTIKPGEYHQFEAATDVLAIESYYGECEPTDIERESCGGRGDI